MRKSAPLKANERVSEHSRWDLETLKERGINLGPMTREELECAIRKPADKIQLEFEPDLVSRILNDVADEPGNLPLLEFVLKELWDKRRGHVLLNETYDAIGGLQGAVATKADVTFASPFFGRANYPPARRLRRADVLRRSLCSPNILSAVYCWP
jgi:hypothetical protein